VHERCFQCGLEGIHRLDCLNTGVTDGPLARANAHAEAMSKHLRLVLESALPVFGSRAEMPIINNVCEYLGDVASYAAAIETSREGIRTVNLAVLSQHSVRLAAHDSAIKAAAYDRLVSVLIYV
jgi:hypothetical protein